MPKLVSNNLSLEEFNKMKQNQMAENHPEKQIAKSPEDEEEEETRFDQFVFLASDQFVNKPRRSFCLCFIFVILLTAITVATGNMGNSDESEYDWNVTDEEYTENDDMLTNLQDRSDIVTSNPATRTVALSDLSMIVTYKNEKNSDIFTPQNLQRMCYIEAKWFADPDYSDYCPLQSENSTSCQDPTESIVALFYGNNYSAWAPSCPLLTDDEVTATSNMLYGNLSTPSGIIKYGFFSGSDYDHKGYTKRTRSLLRVGGPLEGYSITLDEELDQKDQQDDYETFFVQVADEWIDYLGMKGSFMNSVYRDDSRIDGKIEVVWYSWILNGDIFGDMVDADMAMVIFSVLFVWIWMNIHIDSAFLAAVGMFQIFLSLPVGRFFYGVIGQVKYFSILQSLVIFLVLGIGADDVFVLVDAWRQSAIDVPQLSDETDNEWLMRRMVSSYGRTMQAVFNTSFTTTMAFISTAISPIMPISAFGIYASICIVVNYFFVITMTPAALIIHNKYFGGFGPEGWCFINNICCCCKKSAKGNEEKPNQEDTGVELKTVDFEPANLPSGRRRSSSHTDATPKDIDDITIAITKDTELLSKVLVTTFEAEAPPSFGPLQGLKLVSILSVLCNAVLAGFLAAQASTLDLPKEPEQWFPLNHMTQRFIDDSSKFLLGDEASYPTVSLVWGTKHKLDRGDYNHWVPGKNRGVAELDDNFDVADPDALAVISDSCAKLEAKVCKVDGCDPIGYLVQPGSVICAVDEFETWHQATYNSSIYDLGAGSADFYSRLLYFRENTNPTDYPSRSWGEIIGVIDDEPVFMVVEATMSMEYEVTNTELGEVLDVAESMMKTLETTTTAKKVFLASDILAWYATQNALLSGMLVGLAIAFPVAFATLIFATKNVILAFYAIITIGMIVSSVLGSAALNGWGLGISESIAAVIVVGFSVDYTIHLGHMYDHANAHGYQKRVERTRYTILKMGSTVLAGAITTCGSGVFMFACQLTFFNKMAFLICTTIAYSLLYSLTFFVPLLYLLGPNFDSGYVSFDIRALMSDRK
jgi:hypothetical protein